MQTTSTTYRLGLLAILLASVSGCCARWHQIPDDCADAFYGCGFGQVAYNLCSADEPLPCARGVDCPVVQEIERTDDEFVDGEIEDVYESAPPYDVLGAIDYAIDLKRRVAIGPPAVRYRPPSPPKFLTLPTRPILSPVNLDAPLPGRGTVEVDFRTQLAFPGRD